MHRRDTLYAEVAWTLVDQQKVNKTTQGSLAKEREQAKHISAMTAILQHRMVLT